MASDPTVSRTIAALAADAPAALKAINTARSVAGGRRGGLAGAHAPDHGADAASPLVIDLDATPVTSHLTRRWVPQATHAFEDLLSLVPDRNEMVMRVLTGDADLMYCLLVRFRVHDETAARRFDELAVTAVAEITAKEPGTLVYATHRSHGEPLSRVFYEVYRDDEAFQAHERAPHVIDFHARKEELLAGPPDVEVLTLGPLCGWPTA